MYVFRPGVYYSSVLSVLYNVYVVLVHTLYYVSALVKDDAFFIQCIGEEIRTYKQIIFFLECMVFILILRLFCKSDLINDIR